MQKNSISKANHTDEWRRLASMNRHVVRWMIVDSINISCYFSFFFSYLFYILISCFSIKHAAVIELIEDEGSIVKRTMNYHCFNYIIDESFLGSMEHQTLSILKNSVLILLYVYMLFVESKREFFN